MDTGRVALCAQGIGIADPGLAAFHCRHAANACYRFPTTADFFRMLIAARSAEIARCFLASPRSFDRYHYYYARSKLATDPVYDSVLDALRDTQAPVLDVGCGIGLLAHALRANGQDMAYLGLDVDPRKISMAQLGARNAGLSNADFSIRNAMAQPPAHRGSIAILDVLQYLSASAQSQLLSTAAAMLLPDTHLVIRSGLREATVRSRFTRGADWFARAVGWMQTHPQRFPTRRWFEEQIDALGLQATMQPLRGNTPFNNWLIVARLR